MGPQLSTYGRARNRPYPEMPRKQARERQIVWVRAYTSLPTCAKKGSIAAVTAIYHFSAKVISRANGSSAVASAAYRAAERLHDDRPGRDHDFSTKAGVVHSEILAPEGAPERLTDRPPLWNAGEEGEKRKDAQLAREVEVSVPRER